MASGKRGVVEEAQATAGKAVVAVLRDVFQRPLHILDSGEKPTRWSPSPEAGKSCGANPVFFTRIQSMLFMA